MRIVLCLAVLALAGCQTVQGAARDVESAGQAITSTAKEVQSDM